MSEEPRDAYAKRQKRKQQEGQGCALLALAMAGGIVAALAALGAGAIRVFS